MPPLLFSGSSHRILSLEIADILGISLGEVSLFNFPDRETGVKILTDPRGKVAFVLQSCVGRTNDYLVELLLIMDALKRGGAKKIIPILPYFPFCRQDRIDQPGEPIAAKLVADLLETAGADEVISIELHQAQIEGFFSIPLLHLRASPHLFIEPLKKVLKSEPLFLAPDVGSIKIARGYAKAFGTDFVVIDKQRHPREVLEIQLIGDVQGREVVITDDLTATGETIIEAAKLCKEKGAKKILAAVTHALLDQKGWEKFQASDIEHLFVSNSVPNLSKQPKVEVLSLAQIISKSLQNLI